METEQICPLLKIVMVVEFCFFILIGLLGTTMYRSLFTLDIGYIFYGIELLLILTLISWLNLCKLRPWWNLDNQ